MNRHLGFALALLLFFPAFAAAQPFELKKGDHICIIGNTLAERMQHYGLAGNADSQPGSRSMNSFSATSVIQRR